MSFPNVIYGDYGDEKVAQSTKIGSLPLGQLMILPDGRAFRHTRAHTAQAMTAGYLYQADDARGGTSAHAILPATAAVGATSVVVQTPAGTAVLANLYDEGFLMVASSVGTGVGIQYKVKTNNSAAAGSSNFTVQLADGETIHVAIDSTATVGLRENMWAAADLMTADTAFTGPILGIPPVAVSAGFYHWIQRSGQALAQNAGTVIPIGDPVQASTGVAGAIQKISATTVVDPKGRLSTIGQGLTATAGTGSFQQIDLSLE
ncbi:hypothetical protein LCGC14_1094080 [marine sediment metagenome]|uniref:Uncharacterized protein n=1 Tax=marine sediment metagenome TaxID=412755 RepID=A0A0F9MFZ2_9ZZZZ